MLYINNDITSSLFSMFLALYSRLSSLHSLSFSPFNRRGTFLFFIRSALSSMTTYDSDLSRCQDLLFIDLSILDSRCGNTRGEEVVLKVLNLLLKLRSNLRFKAVKQVLLQIIESFNLWGAVVVIDAAKYIDELTPLLGLSEDENERVEKLG